MLRNTIYVIAQTNPLIYLISKSYLSRRASKWVMLPQEFDLVFITQKLIKVQLIKKFIANHPINKILIAQEEFLDEVDGQNKHDPRDATQF